jgi:hypothetical protein
MRMPWRRSRTAKLIDRVDEASEKTSVRAALLTAAGVVGLTAASARISALRRRGAASNGS